MATAVHGRPIARRPDENGRPGTVDLEPAWPTVTVHAAVGDALGAPITPDTPLERLRAAAERHGIPPAAPASAGALVVDLYEQLVEPNTTTPTFYTDFPIEASPLARTHRGDPGWPNAGTSWPSAWRSGRPTPNSATPSTSVNG